MANTVTLARFLWANSLPLTSRAASLAERVIADLFL
jgi:hypothetical protein